MPRPETDKDRETRFRLLVEQTEGDIYSYALRRVARAEDAADVVAETFLTAWRRLDKLPKGGEARLWLFGVARNQISNLNRGRLRSERLSERLRQDMIRVRPVVDSPGADRPELIEALTRLSDDDREVLTLLAWDELKPAEIATVMGLRGPTVRSRIHRAKERFKAELSVTTTEEAGNA